jgi:hypothetical protein
MPKPGIVICLSGGSVRAVFATRPETTVAIVNWDADLEDHDLPGVVLFERNGRKVPAFVVQFKTQPLAALKGSDAEQALQATRSSKKSTSFVSG